MPTAPEIIAAIDLKGCAKVFIVLFILSMVFFVFFTLIKPDKSRKLGILPFPTTGPYVPLDSSDCGRNVVNCTNPAQNCSSLCDSSGYKCTSIPYGQEVWYLGTKLLSPDKDHPQSYCLPQQNINNLTDCGTYTGKAVWVQDHWECQCKYPTLFNGDRCLNQIACSDDTGDPLNCPPDSKTCGKLVKTDGSGTIWDGANPQGIAPSDNPLDWDPKNPEKPLYACDCDNKQGSYLKAGDPYRCHTNLCYAGGSQVQSPAAYFDGNSNKCVCDNVYTVKSNVTGFCYPIDNGEVDGNCDPDILTGNCTCGNRFIQAASSGESGSLGVFFRQGNDIYVTYEIPGDPLCQEKNCPIYKVLVNGTTAKDGQGQDILSTLRSTLPDIKGAIIEFQLMQYKTLLGDPPRWTDINSSFFMDYIVKSFPAFSTPESVIKNMNLSTNFVTKGLVPIPCDSYFYNRPHDIGCPDAGCIKCSDPYYAPSSTYSDLNNKNGTLCYNPTLNQDCGGNADHINIDIFDPEGYACICKISDCIYNADVSKGNGHIGHVCNGCPHCTGDPCATTQDGLKKDDSICMPCHHCNWGSSQGKLVCGGDW